MASVMAAGLALVTAVSGTPAAQADSGAITTQWYLESSGLAALKAKGLDGRGVRIAVLDGPPMTGVPELGGAEITVRDYCKAKHSVSHRAHGTNVLSLLASPDYGWAPKAEYTVYVMPLGTVESHPKACQRHDYDDMAWLVNKALDDGADLISIQVGGPVGYSLGYAFARAALQGVPVLIGAGNEHNTQLLTAGLNTTVAVGAVDRNRELASFSNYGTGLTVMAPGTDIAIRNWDESGRTSQVVTWYGTSLAGPQVVGAMALAMQAWPQANGNQLIRSLIATADTPPDGWDPRTGWGVLDAEQLIATDPSGQSTENPLLDKSPDEDPTGEHYADYRDGLTDTALLIGDNSYVYRGDDELICADSPRCELNTSPRFAVPASSPVSAEPGVSASPPAATTSESAAPLPLLAVGGLAVLVAIGALSWLFVRTRRVRT